MLKNSIQVLSHREAESCSQAAGGIEPDSRRDSEFVAGSGATARPGQARLASFDAVTAVAVIGAIDAVQGLDTVLPPLDLSQSVPKTAAVDLADIDLADLTAIAVDPATRHAKAPEVDLGELGLERLLALRTEATGEPQTNLPRVAMEDLMRVDVEANGQDPYQTPIDLIGVDPEALQDVTFGKEVVHTTPYRWFEALDLASILDEPREGDFGFLDRAVRPMTIATSDYGSAHAGDAGTRITGSNIMVVASPHFSVDETGPGSPAIGPATQPPTALYDMPEFTQGRALDGPGAVASNTVGIDMTRANQSPVAQNDLFIDAANAPIAGNVLTNDHDPDGDTLTVSSNGLLATDQGGAVLLNEDGTFEYKPPDAFTGTDGVSYAVTDGFGGEAAATITFAVISPRRVLNGGTGDDALQGGAGGDVIRGEAGNDLLMGKAGDDVLDGGIGTDVLQGGAGVDIFTIGRGAGGDLDTIADFKSNVDVIDLRAFGFSGFSDLSIEPDGLGGSVITLPGGDGIAVLLVDPASLLPGDFIF